MLDYFRDVIASSSSSSRVREIEYRALSPLYAGQEYSIRAEHRNPELAQKRANEEEKSEAGDPGSGGGDLGQTWDIYVEREGTLCMKAVITTFAP